MMQFLAAKEAALLSVDEVVTRLGADPNRGLEEPKAERRLLVHGANEFEIAKEEAEMPWVALWIAPMLANCVVVKYHHCRHWYYYCYPQKHQIGFDNTVVGGVD